MLSCNKDILPPTSAYILRDVPHYNDVKMSTTTSQITSLMIVYSIVYSSADQRKHQSSALLTFVRGIHRRPVNSPHKGPVTRKMFPFDDVIMISTCLVVATLFEGTYCWCSRHCLWNGQEIPCLLAVQDRRVCGVIYHKRLIESCYLTRPNWTFKVNHLECLNCNGYGHLCLTRKKLFPVIC